MSPFVDRGALDFVLVERTGIDKQWLGTNEGSHVHLFGSRTQRPSGQGFISLEKAALEYLHNRPDQIVPDVPSIVVWVFRIQNHLI